MLFLMYLDTVWTVFITPDSNDFQYMDQKKKKKSQKRFIQVKFRST